MVNELKQIVDFIEKENNFLLIAHKRPDGDAIGSTLALTLALKNIGKNAIPFCIDEVSHDFQFLSGYFEIQKTLELKDVDVFLALDCASISQTGLDESLIKTKPIINIDHHISNENYGDLNLVNPQVGSTAEILFFLIRELGVKIDKKIATALLTGIYTDTGGFMHSNTTIENLKIASQLISMGASIKKISKNLFGYKPPMILKIWSNVLSNLKQTKKGISFSFLTYKEMMGLNATSNEVQDAIELVRQIPNTKIALFLYEEEEGLIKGSLRTEEENIDVSYLASLFGGGGHKKASGFEIKGKIQKTNNSIKII